MTRPRFGARLWALALTSAACSSDPVVSTDQKPTAAEASELTYHQDIAPLFADHCMQCHRGGGIAPFRLDDYASAKQHARAIALATAERSMPPWSVTSDGSCGDFADSLALGEEEIARIGAWVNAGTPEGEPAAIQVPDLPSLRDAVELSTPDFLPVAQHDAYAEHDEYRCFELPLPTSLASERFITGYEILPGTPEIVHHVMMAIVDPDAPAHAEDAKRTNAEQVQLLDQQSPDRDGWSCFGQVGDGVEVVALPVIWAPGQGVVRFPGQSGVALSPRHKLIVQVHYNLEDHANEGKHDQTRIRLAFADHVARRGQFVTADALLDTLFKGEPASLPPGRASTTYAWSTMLRDTDLGAYPELQLYGVMPHMHQLGHKLRMQISDGAAPDRCAADVQAWDFHWQRMFFYKDPITVHPDTKLSVTCDFDTRPAQAPVLPGWGTSNEMCLVALYFTVPG